jgi:predicted lipid-binding transport protein (Tim44 family)
LFKLMFGFAGALFGGLLGLFVAGLLALFVIPIVLFALLPLLLPALCLAALIWVIARASQPEHPAPVAR